MATAAALTAVEKPAPTGIDQYRYPGPKEFEDTPESHRRFFGRDAEIRAITQQIMASRLLVLYGNSGLGKSSLLKAGVFPVLRAEALLPIRVRLKASTDLLKLIAESCEEVSREFNIDYSPGTGDTCWEFFKTAMFWRGDTLLLPVLVFDQFEEIFTLMDAEWRKNFALDLGPLVSGSLPPAVREKLRSGTSGLSDVPPKVKVVFSLREEYYGSLQDLSSDLPTLFQDRFRLLPLDESQARDAIQKPALLDAASDSSSASQLLSPPFHYSEETLAAMLKFLKGRSQTIEPFQLQLLCQHVEQVVVESKRLAAAQPPIEIAPDDLGGEQAMALVLRRFYANTLNQLPALERRRARELCDSGLLSPAGHRLMLQEDQIRHEYGVSATTLKYLVDRRILRQEPRLESMFYEISHDTIAQSISRTRGWRFPKKWRLALIVAAASLIVLFAFGLLTILSLTREQNQTNEARRKADEERNKAENLVAFLIGEDLLSKIRPVGQLDIMEDIQREVNKSYSKTKETTDVGMRNQGLAYLNQGDLDYAHYFLQKAQGNYDSALKLFETLLSRNADNPDWQHDRADAKAKLAHVFADQLQLPQALELSREALKIQEELVGRNAGNGGETLDRLLREEAQSYIAVGEILSRQGHLREALEYFQKCLDAAKSKDTTEWLYIREDGLLGKGNVFFPQGDVRGAEIAFNEAYKTAQRAFEKSPFAPEAQYKIALAASNLAKLPSQTPENTLRNLRTAHETIQKTATWDPTNMRWKRDLAATYILLANGDGNPESARAEYSKALEIIGQLATIDRTNKILNQDLISLHLSIGDALLSNTASSASIFSGVESEAERVTTMLGSNAGANAPGKAAVLAHGSPARRTDATGQSQMSNEALEQYESGLKLAGTLEETDQTDNDLHDESIGLALREARLLRGESHFDRALEFSDRANKELEKLFVDPTDNLRLELRGLIHEEKGGAFLGRHESSKAAEELSSASADINTLTRERAANAQYWNDKFLLSYEFAAALSAQRNDKPGTFDAYREAVEAEEKATALEPKAAVYRSNLAMAHQEIGDRFRDAGHLPEAQASYAKAEEAWRNAIALKANDVGYKNSLFLFFFSHLAPLREKQKDQGGTLDAYRQAVDNIQKAVALQPKTPVYRCNLALADEKLGDAFLAKGATAQKIVDVVIYTDLAQAQASYAQSEQAFREAIRQKNDPDYWNQLSLLFVDHIAPLRSKQGDESGALETERQALDAIQKAVKVDPKNAIYLFNLGWIQLQIGAALFTQGDLAQAQQLFSQAQKAFEEAARQKNDASYWNRLFLLLHDHVAPLRKKQKDQNGQLDAYRQGLEAVKKAVALDPKQDAYYLNLGVVQMQIGDSMHQKGDLPEAETLYQQSEESFRKAIQLKDNATAYWENLCWLLMSRATLHEERGEQADATANYREALNALNKAAELPGDKSGYSNVRTRLEKKLNNKGD